MNKIIELSKDLQYLYNIVLKYNGKRYYLEVLLNEDYELDGVKIENDLGEVNEDSEEYKVISDYIETEFKTNN